MNKHYRYYDVVMSLFVTILILSNILSSAKLIDLNTSLGPLRLAFDAGTLVFPISYIFGDILTEVYGYQRSRRVIWMGFGAMILVAFFIWLAGELPGDPSWEAEAGQAQYKAILGGVTGLSVASILAYWVGEFSNSYVLAKLKIKTEGKWLWLRTIGSTLVGQGVDTITFFLIATYITGVFPPELFLTLIVTNYILKVGIEVILTPITLTLVNWLKKQENEDYYDTETNFNPFKITA